jgi:hypothetical protein
MTGCYRLVLAMLADGFVCVANRCDWNKPAADAHVLPRVRR